MRIFQFDETCANVEYCMQNLAYTLVPEYCLNLRGQTMFPYDTSKRCEVCNVYKRKEAK